METYKGLFERLKGEAEASGIVVLVVPAEKMKDYVGMNSEAAKAMGYKMPENTIYIKNGLPESAQYHTLRHEYTEMSKMRGGMSYWQAHNESLATETHHTMPPPMPTGAKILKQHDDGDLTIKHKGTQYVVTTEGGTFKRVSGKQLGITPKTPKIR